MEHRTKFQDDPVNQFALSVLLSIILIFGMLPASPTKALASTNNQGYVYQQIYKTYVYNYMYGVYNNEYALGFQSYYGLIEQVDVVSATKGVTLSVKNYGYDNPYWLTSWIYGLTQASVPDVVGMPVRSGKTVKYTPFKLSGEKLSDTKFDKVVYFNSKSIAGGKGTTLFKASKKKCVIDVYNNYGKKVQSINAKTKNGQTGGIEYQNGRIYINVQSTWYILKSGKFVKSKKPAANYATSDNYPLLLSDTVYNPDASNGNEYSRQWYLLTKKGTRIDLPSNGGASYTKVNDLGVYCIDGNKKCRIYNNQGKLLKVLGNVRSLSISESTVPKVFVVKKNGKLAGAYNSSFKLITKSKALVENYANCWFAGTYKKQKIYAIRCTSKQMNRNWICKFLKKNMTPLKLKNYSLVGKVNNTLSAPENISNRKAFVGMDSKGKLFLLNSKGKKIISFSFTNFDVRENTKYALVANGKKWSFIPL